MAYNFPVGYQPGQIYYPQQYQPSLTQQNQSYSSQPQQNANSIIWVQGEAGAKSYLVAPNTTVQLWDSEDQVIYLKSADASGMPSMKILDYKIRDTSSPAQQTQAIVNEPVNPVPNADYVTRDELKAFETQIQEQIANIARSRKVNAKKENGVDE